MQGLNIMKRHAKKGVAQHSNVDLEFGGQHYESSFKALHFSEQACLQGLSTPKHFFPIENAGWTTENAQMGPLEIALGVPFFFVTLYFYLFINFLGNLSSWLC